jgi:hypothetical protein
MKALVVLAFLMGVMAMIRFVPMEPVDSQRARAIAVNYAAYRNAVYLHVFNGNKASGSIAAASLNLPAGFALLRSWQARIDAGCLYVWGPASSEEIEATRDLFWGSQAVGCADGGKLEPGHGGTTPVPSFVPDGSLVSVVGID